MDNAVGNPQQYGLSGTGAAPPLTPLVTLNPAGTFNLAGTTTQGTTAGPQNLTVSNTGTASLHVTAIGVSGLNASDFSVAGSHCLGTAVAAGTRCSIPVTFAPLASGIRTTTLSITDDERRADGAVQPASHSGRRFQRDAGVRVCELQRAQRDSDKRSGREFHGDGDNPRQRGGCADGSTNISFQAG
jgi:hypothetical protein